MAFLERKISLTFVLGQGSFGDSGFDTIKVKDLRVSARIAKAGGPAVSQLSLDVWGLTPSVMRQLSTLGLNPTLDKINSITVEAGDDENGLATVFIGSIINGYADYQTSPQVSFHVEAGSGVLDNLIPHPPLSVVGSVDVVTVLSGLARKMNLVFESNGVQKRLPTIYLTGSARQLAYAICDAANLECTIDNGVFAVWEPNSSRGGTIPLISKDTGMQGYPAFTSNGLMLKVLFDPTIQFGGQIEVRSSRPELIGANGIYTIYGLDYSLDAIIPAGEWSCTIQASPIGFGPQIGTASR